MGAYAGQDEIRRPLSNDVPNSPSNNDIIILIPIKIEILFHTRDERVGDIRSIDLA